MLVYQRVDLNRLFFAQFVCSFWFSYCYSHRCHWNPISFCSSNFWGPGKWTSERYVKKALLQLSIRRRTGWRRGCPGRDALRGAVPGESRKHFALAGGGGTLTRGAGVKTTKRSGEDDLFREIGWNCWIVRDLSISVYSVFWYLNTI